MENIRELCKQYDIHCAPSTYEYRRLRWKKLIPDVTEESIFKRYKSLMKLTAFKNFHYEDSDYFESTFGQRDKKFMIKEFMSGGEK